MLFLFSSSDLYVYLHFILLLFYYLSFFIILTATEKLYENEQMSSLETAHMHKHQQTPACHIC